MTTIAAIIGEKDDPKMEAAVLAFHSEVAKMEQEEVQNDFTPIERKIMEWNAVVNIISAWEMGVYKP